MENELRRDYFLDRQVIIAVGRGRRPSDYKHEASTGGGDPNACFFCPGKEHMTPPEIMRIDGAGGWSMRVFPNKFPAVKLETGEETQYLMPAYGSHEVVVESPDHDKTVADLPVESIERLIGVYTQRVESMLKDPKIKYALVFKNHGKAAGASLTHTHTQIASLPVVPRLVREEIDSAKAYREKNGRCPFCHTIEKEAAGPRSIWEDQYVSAYAPYASRCHMESWIMPKRHIGALKELTKEERSSLAAALKHVLSGLKNGMGDPPYNFHIHAAPEGQDLHLHIEVMPRLSTWAGFELGSEVTINSMPPETAAQFLRQK